MEPPDLARLEAWAEVIDDSNYYEILGVLPLADGESIRAAFRELALAFHPDVHADAPEEVAELAHSLFRRIAEAYRALSDPETRTRYDLAIAQGHLRMPGADATGRARAPGALKSLEDVCRTPAARLAASRADDAIGSGRLDEARALLRQAIAHDGYENPELEERLEALEFMLFAQGD